MKLNIVGYLGFSNFGDDLMLLGLLDHLNKKNIYKIKVFVKNKSGFEDYISRWDKLDIRLITLNKFSTLLLPFYVFQSPITAWCGGTCLYEDPTDTNLHGLKWLSRLASYSSFFGRKLVLINIGVNRITGSQATFLTSKIVERNNTFISVRDNSSLENIYSKFSPSNLVVVGGDLACLNYIDLTCTTHTSRHIVFCGHSQYANDTELISFYAKNLSEISRDLDKPIVFIAMHGGADSDTLFHKKIMERMDTPSKIIPYTTGNMTEIYDYFKSAYCVISMRLHGVVLAELLMKPNLGISYSKKVEYFIMKTCNVSNTRIKKIGENITSSDINQVVNHYKLDSPFVATERNLAILGIEKLI